MPGTILIVDDNAIFRQTLRSYIERNTDWQVCGEAENGKGAVEQVEEMHPEVVILGLHLPILDSLQATRQIKKLAPDTTMLMLSTHVGKRLLNNAQAAGVKNVLLKSDGIAENLLACLKSLHIERGDHLSLETSR